MELWEVAFKLEAQAAESRKSGLREEGGARRGGAVKFDSWTFSFRL